MQFKRRMLAALTALLLGILGGAESAPLFAAPAQAETVEMPPLEISAAVTPELLYEATTVEITFSITNPGDETLRSVSMTAPDGLLTVPLGDLAPGQTLTFIHTHTTSQAELDAQEVTCLLSFQTDAGRFSYPADAPLNVDNSAPQIEFLRQVSNRYVSDSGSVTIVYQVRNTGTVPVTSLTLRDAFSSFEAQHELLSPGENWVLVDSTSLESDVSSQPSLIFTAKGETLARTLDPLSIRQAHGKLDTSITAGRSLFDPDSAEVILTLSNGGDVNYSDMVIYDDVYGGVIADSIRLPAGGEPVTISHTYPLRGDSTYRWRVTGVNAAGERIDFVTDIVSVYADDASDDALLTLSATAGMTHISRGGFVPFTFELTNIGSETASNVTIYEPSLGDVSVLAVVPTGDPTIRVERLEVPADSVYHFSAIYTDRHGQVRTAICDPIEITIGPGGESPEKEHPVQDPYSGSSSQFSESSLFFKLIIGSGIVLLGLIIALLVTSRRATMQRKVRDAVRKQRQDARTKAAKRPKTGSKG